MPDSEAIYEEDPHAAADAGYDRGELELLSPGARGRMLDPRRTPVTVLGTDATTATFTVHVAGFEDEGAVWTLPLEDVAGFQFERGGTRLAEDASQALRDAVRRLSRRLRIARSESAAAQTRGELETERTRLHDALATHAELRQLDVGACVAARRASEAAAAVLEELLERRGLAALDADFTRDWVSNPRSGEVVLGHEIVLAEMGLCSFDGRAPRTPDVFAGERGRARRRAHLLLRMAYARELLVLAGADGMPLYRGAAVEQEATGPDGSSPLISATFSQAVAAEHFTAAPAGIMQRRKLPLDRVLMTFLETRAMNERYREAEAVLLRDARTAPF